MNQSNKKMNLKETLKKWTKQGEIYIDNEFRLKFVCCICKNYLCESVLSLVKHCEIAHWKNNGGSLLNRNATTRPRTPDPNIIDLTSENEEENIQELDFIEENLARICGENTNSHNDQIRDLNQIQPNTGILTPQASPVILNIEDFPERTQLRNLNSHTNVRTNVVNSPTDCTTAQQNENSFSTVLSSSTNFSSNLRNALMELTPRNATQRSHNTHQTVPQYSPQYTTVNSNMNTISNSNRSDANISQFNIWASNFTPQSETTTSSRERFRSNVNSLSNYKEGTQLYGNNQRRESPCLTYNQLRRQRSEPQCFEQQVNSSQFHPHQVSLSNSKPVKKTATMNPISKRRASFVIRRYQCEHCKSPFVNKQNYEKHLNKHHGSNVDSEMFYCPECDRNYKQTCYRKHFNTLYHQKNVTRKQSEIVANAKSPAMFPKALSTARMTLYNSLSNIRNRAKSVHFDRY